MSTLRVGTLNVDFGRGKKAVRRDILAGLDRCDVLLLQECKNVFLRALLPKGVGVRQLTKTAALRGSAIVWNKKGRVGRIRRGKGSGKRVLGAAGVKGLLTRYGISIRLNVAGVPIVFVSFHQIPMRAWKAQPGKYAAFSQRVRKFMRTRAARVVAGGDKNKLVGTDPMNMRGAGFTVRGGRIDGFAYSSSLDAGRKVQTYPGIGPQGHPLVVVTLDLS